MRKKMPDLSAYIASIVIKPRKNFQSIKNIHKHINLVPPIPKQDRIYLNSYLGQEMEVFSSFLEQEPVAKPREVTIFSPQEQLKVLLYKLEKEFIFADIQSAIHLIASMEGRVLSRFREKLKKLELDLSFALEVEQIEPEHIQRAMIELLALVNKVINKPVL